MRLKQIQKDLVEALGASKPKTSGYDTEATVIRTEGQTAWVHIPGGIDETPVAMTINSKRGDKVRVRVSGGSAWLIGNDSAPPTDDRKAIEAAVLRRHGNMPTSQKRQRNQRKRQRQRLILLQTMH